MLHLQQYYANIGLLKMQVDFLKEINKDKN